MARTLRLFAGLMAAAACSLGQDSGDAAPAAPQLAVLMKFDVRPAAAVLESMQSEVARIFEPAGVRVAWRLAEQNDGRELFPHVVVIRIRGVCHTQPSSWDEVHMLLDDPELASASVRDGKALPFAEIHCDRVSAFLRPWRKAEQTATLGAAMGRVIAHELYHMLTNTLTHGVGVLSKASVTSMELGRSGRFSQDEIELVKKSVQ
ncbi:MAG TPA: hypothetical protein VEV85_03340 [Bryobacteraceae bacterium]|nr:hypothetical protein [Bryobacteraceae bacterium]